MIYRKDIDGLRAVAVIAVVMFHGGLNWLPGGFVGVDIFFVISGYLITRMLTEEMSAGQYSVLRFYLRRARRILPALYVMTLAVMLLGVLLLTPLELMALSNTVVASQSFSSNFLFWMQSGYFDVLSELKPLLHTWSLSVEEQFYIVWPFALYSCVKRAWSIPWVITGMMVISFAMSCLYLERTPSAIFYLLPGRLWEMLLGAWVAAVVWNGIKNRVFKELAALAGLILVTASFIWLDRSMSFPGWNALFPCAGAALLIAAGSGSIVDRYLLGKRPVVFLGLISYSLYLWHWPLLAYVRVVNLGELPAGQSAVALCLAAILATLSWRFVEKPYRISVQSDSRVRDLLYFVPFGLCLCTFAWWLLTMEGLPSRIPKGAVDAQMAAKDTNPLTPACHLNMAQVSIKDITKCTIEGKSDALAGEVAVWGDSHADAIFPGVTALPGLKFIQLSKTSCPPLIGVVVVRGIKEYSECALFNEGVLEMLQQHAEIETVVLAGRWAVYALNQGFGVPEDLPNAPIYTLQGSSDQYLAKSNSLQVFGFGLNKTIALLVKAGKKVVVVGAVPEMKFDVPGCVARKRMAFVNAEDCGVALDVVRTRIAAVDKVIESSARANKVKALFPDQILCGQRNCGVEGKDGQILYYDHNHLSTAGAKYVFSRLMVQE